MLDITRFNTTADIALARKLHKRGWYIVVALYSWIIPGFVALGIVIVDYSGVAQYGLYCLALAVSAGYSIPIAFLIEKGNLPPSGDWVESKIENMRHEESVLDREIADS